MKTPQELRQSERDLREDYANVQEVVLELNNREAALLDRKARVEGLRKQVVADREKVVAAIHKRPPKPKSRENPHAEVLYTRLEALNQTRSRLKATDRRLDQQIVEIDSERLPFVQTQKRLSKQIDANVAAQHEAHFEPTKHVKETEPMKVPGPDEFRRVSTVKEKTPERAAKPLASTERLQELKSRLSQPKPAPELSPPGMSPNLAKRVKQDKAIGDEIVRIQKALNARRGQARDGFGRSAGG